MSRPLILRADPASPDPAAVAAAADVLRSGGLVAFPTETVYGLGAHAHDAAAVRRVFDAKGRPADNPLIVHVADLDAAAAVAVALTPLARDLARRFWPGPLTLVLDARPGLPAEVSAGLGTVALRVPDHPVALALLRAAAIPVAAPSANRSGRPSPTTAAHVLDELADHVDAVLDGGPCRVGVESTVVDARGDTPVVLRDGGVTREQLGLPTGDADAEEPADSGERALAASPGTRHAHYRPDCRVELAAPGTAAPRAAELCASGLRTGLVATEPAPDGVVQIGRYRDAAQLAMELYGLLRAAETAGLDVLVVETVAPVGLGRAVMDRLRRAAGEA